MRLTLTVFLFLSALFILPSCKKACQSTCVWGCSTSYTAAGITTRDVNGNLTNVQTDSTDWRVDETWCDQELGFFGRSNLSQYNNTGLSTTYRDSLLCQYQNNCNVNGSIAYGAAGYPNPFRGSLVIEIPAQGADTLQMVLINSKEQNILSKVISHDSLTSNTFDYNLTGIVDSGQIFRIYYMFKYPNSNYYFKGHGDLQTQ